jgi:hypothetical protein
MGCLSVPKSPTSKRTRSLPAFSPAPRYDVKEAKESRCNRKIISPEGGNVLHITVLLHFDLTLALRR